MPAIPFSSARRDLFLVLLLAIAVFILAAWLEASEYLLALLRPFEFAQLDELPLMLLVLSTGLVWFARRRWLEARQELHARIAGERELEASREQLRQLTRQGLALQESERRALARELHDELGQYLNAIKIDAVAIRATASGQREPTQQAAASIISLADHAYAAVRNIVGRLRPVALDELGLPVALEHLRATWQQRLPKLEIGLQVAMLDTLEPLFDESTALMLYRVTQEALNNVVRHADAQRVIICIRQIDGAIELVIADDGCGFDACGKNAGLGLLGIRERAEAVGGKMTIVSAAGKGCTLIVRLPCPAGAETGVRP
ncbi:MAG: sensor histidine kinase [Rugosibacter sp.]|nr:sensor histidine kinase [Rugosibacter sp.]